MREIVGGLMLATPIIVLFGLCAADIGLRGALAIFGGTILMFLWFGGGAYLLYG